MVYHGSQPIIDILVEGRRIKALVDTGCTNTLILSNLSGIDDVLGMDVIIQLGGVDINKDGTVEFGKKYCAISIQWQFMDSKNSKRNTYRIVVKDFCAESNGKR